MIALQLTPNDISIIQHALNITAFVLDVETAPEEATKYTKIALKNALPF